MDERYKKTNIVLGEGSYKTVSKATDMEEGKEVAYNELKIKKYEQEHQAGSSFSKEIALLKNIHHPNIIQILDYWFKDDNFIFITELMTGGTMKDYISKMGAINDKLIKKWAKQILNGIHYLHTQNIIHRDIKSENVFVNASAGEIKIGDLGISKEKSVKMYTMVGTLNFMSREMFEGEGYDESVDIYAFGMTLIHMATARTPYVECVDASAVKKNVLSGIPPDALNLVENRCLKHLIVSCLATPTNRFTAEECLSHHFFNDEKPHICLPDKCCLIQPLGSNKNISLSIYAYKNNTISFQIQVKEKGTEENYRFIKFDYDCQKDSVKKICDELQKENVIENDRIKVFAELLEKGIKKADQKLQAGEIGRGFFEIEENEDINEELVIKSKDSQIKPKKPIVFVEDVDSKPVVLKKETPKEPVKDEHKYATNTIEIMNEIENEMMEKAKAGKSDNFCKERSPSPLRKQIDAAEDNIDLAMVIYQQHMTRASSETLSSSDKLNFDISKAYEITKEKFEKNHPIEEFTMDACRITQRDPENAKQWAKTFIKENVLTTYDLKLLIPDDWEKIGLTIFACRTMQNMLYGHNGQKTFKPKTLRFEFDYSCSIEEFVHLVCTEYNKIEFEKAWTNSFKSEDIQTFGELKALTLKDWWKLDLSVLGRRLLYDATQ